MIPKYGTRKVNKALVKAVNTLPCNACLKPAPNDAHHIKSRGSGGHDETWNLVSLCRQHHTELHKIGLVSFAEKYELFKMVLIAKKWSLDNGKWRHE